MGGTKRGALTFGDWVERMQGPAALGHVFSAGELRQRAAWVRRLRTELPAEQFEAMRAQIPQGYVEGFEAYDERFRKGSSKLADNHPKRLRLLSRAEALPFLSFQEILHHTEKTVFTAEPPEVVPDYVVNRLSADEHKAQTREAAAIMQMLRMLVLLSMRGGRQYPVGMLLIFLLLLTDLVLADCAEACQVIANPPVRVTRPPGRAVLAEPRVARAPGGRGSLVADRSEGRAGLCASRGNAVVP